MIKILAPPPQPLATCLSWVGPPSEWEAIPLGQMEMLFSHLKCDIYCSKENKIKSGSFIKKKFNDPNIRLYENVVNNPSLDFKNDKFLNIFKD